MKDLLKSVRNYLLRGGSTLDITRRALISLLPCHTWFIMCVLIDKQGAMGVSDRCILTYIQH